MYTSDALVDDNLIAAFQQINVPGMVDTFKTKYEGLQIPYPSDGGALKGKAIVLRFKEENYP